MIECVLDAWNITSFTRMKYGPCLELHVRHRNEENTDPVEGIQKENVFCPGFQLTLMIQMKTT